MSEQKIVESSWYPTEYVAFFDCPHCGKSMEKYWHNNDRMEREKTCPKCNKIFLLKIRREI